MKHYEPITRTENEIIAITCDACGRYFQDQAELQAFVHIAKTGSYGNIFGDGVEISCDLCQHCLKERLGDAINTTPVQERA